MRQSVGQPQCVRMCEAAVLMMQHIQTHLQTVFLPHKSNQDAQAHSLTGDGAFLRNQSNGFLRMFSKSVGRLRPWRNWSHSHHVTFHPFFFVKSSSSLTAFNVYVSARLQLSSCITLSISPLCFPFSTFFSPSHWTEQICKSQGKRGVEGHKPIQPVTQG